MEIIVSFRKILKEYVYSYIVELNAETVDVLVSEHVNFKIFVIWSLMIYIQDGGQ